MILERRIFSSDKSNKMFDRGICNAGSGKIRRLGPVDIIYIDREDSPITKANMEKLRELDIFLKISSKTHPPPF